MTKKQLILGLGLLAIVAVIVVAAWLWPTTKSAAVSDYQSCVAKGYPVQQSYPSVCRVPGGASFTNPNEVAPTPPQ